MGELEQLLGLFAAAVILAAAAPRVAAPYPVFWALGGAVLALVPAAPSFALPPELALALFVAPVLLDAAYDASLRDLRDNWAPVTGLVVFAVGITHQVEEELDWIEMAGRGKTPEPPVA
jgi:NhaP-type Na+/H+ or K+/H+ antiporter